MCDQDHLRDDPSLPGHHATRHPLDRGEEDNPRRTPIMRPLGMTDAETWDWELSRD